MMQGTSPPVQAALDLYHILSESDTDLRQPVGLKKQLLQEYSLDADVGQSMLQLLQVLRSSYVSCVDQGIVDRLNAYIATSM